VYIIQLNITDAAQETPAQGAVNNGWFAWMVKAFRLIACGCWFGRGLRRLFFKKCRKQLGTGAAATGGTRHEGVRIQVV